MFLMENMVFVSHKKQATEESHDFLHSSKITWNFEF